MLRWACRMIFSSQRVSAAALTLLAALMAGCASPGPPRAPSLHLPERPADVKAERQGGAVVLRFMTPARSSDGQLLTAPVMAGLCRAVGDGLCKATESFPAKVKVAGAVVWKDVLPADLASGPDRLLTYRVELFTPGGRSAGPSDPAFAAAGVAPEEVRDLRAEGSRRGVVLQWQPVRATGAEVLLEREDVAAMQNRQTGPQPPKRKPVSRKGGTRPEPVVGVKHSGKPAAEEWMHSERVDGGDPGGMVDRGALPGVKYQYMAVRSRKVTVGGKELELRSEDSAVVPLEFEDVYPPSAPRGVQAASFAPEGSALAADLVWEPDTETDLAGYNVYRATALAGGGYGERVKLTATPVALPGFHDATIARGVGYRYTVTAVDRKGNESAGSEAAELAPTP